MEPLNIRIADCRYRAMIGVGGIGTGFFFALDGNQSLGRNESRSGQLLDYRDYCKLHIISYYVQALLGQDFKTVLVGKVGNDEGGKALLSEMQQSTLDTRYVETVAGQHTLLSACFLYPDGSGGNITSSNSACALVDPPFVNRVEPEFKRYAQHGIALAVPEVPLEARWELLRLGSKYGFLRAASFTTGEIMHLVKECNLQSIDLLAVNMEEAAAFIGLDAERAEPAVLVEAVIDRLQATNAQMRFSMTAGSKGSWLWDGLAISHVPAIPMQVVSTAGAGDAHLAGLIVGLVANLSLQQASELGALVAALSVTSPHTINKGITRKTLRALAAETMTSISPRVKNLLED